MTIPNRERHLPLLTALLLALPLSAQGADGDWFARAGAHVVYPRSDNGTLAGGALRARIDSGVRPTLAFGRHFGPRWAAELLLALPFTHTASLNGTDALDFEHLPPTLSLQHYFAPDARLNPFVGIGVNYTLAFDERERGPLAGTRTRLGNSFGPALQAGLVFETRHRWNVIADVRWADIDVDVSVDGADIGSVRVDPLVYGVSIGWKF